MHRRDQRALHAAAGFVLGPAAPPSAAADHLTGWTMRAGCLLALRQLVRAAAGGSCPAAAAAVLQLARELRGRAEQAGRTRHFANSASHRLQLRAYQGLLVLHTGLPQVTRAPGRT